MPNITFSNAVHLISGESKEFEVKHSHSQLSKKYNVRSRMQEIGVTTKNMNLLTSNRILS